jgi:hypothetical protein
MTKVRHQNAPGVTPVVTLVACVLPALSVASR